MFGRATSMCADIAFLFARAQANGELLSHFVRTFAGPVITIRAMASAANSKASAEQPAQKHTLPFQCSSPKWFLVVADGVIVHT